MRSKARIPIFLILALGYIANAQDEPFRGGPGDGHSVVALLDSSFTMQKGGAGDGYALMIHEPAAHTLFQGGAGDGYALEVLEPSAHRLYMGGVGDGYELEHYETPVHTLFQGGAGDGYVLDTYENLTNIFSKGGAGDGYSTDSFVRNFWTGDIGTAWLSAGNWSLDRIPISSDHVVIAGGKPNYPQLGPLQMVVGNVPSTAAYVCRSLQVRNNAFLTGNLNTTMENKSLIQIRGTLRWQNLSDNAWVNQPGSEVFVDDGGKLVLRTN